ncbi:MAG: O-antigen ligase family protein [Firmicutes bacterium]|nr:O-antigen ligase family protein [Bacillota bacterium]
MVTVYPLVVYPNSLNNYFYLPKYLVLAVVSLFSLYVLLREKGNVKHPAFIPLSIFLLCVLVSAILASDTYVAFIGTYRFTGFTTYLFCFILFTVAFQVKSKEKVLVYMISCAAIISIITVLQYFDINIVPHESFRGIYHREGYGTMANPNFLGTYVAFILPGATIFYLQYKKLYWLLCSALIYAGLLVCLTRGAWLAAFISFLFIVIYSLRITNWKRNLVWIILVFIVVTGTLLPTKDGLIYKRALSIPQEMDSAIQLEDKAGTKRMLIWKESFNLLPQYWVFGMGPDHLRYAEIMTNEKSIVDKAHNIYLEIAVTMGIPALIAYLIFLSYFFRQCRDTTEYIFLMMIVTYLIQGFFNIDVVMVLPLFWIILGLSLNNLRDGLTGYYNTCRFEGKINV